MTAGAARWTQLLLGVTCMMVISSPQYVWALFTQPLTRSLHATLADIQVTFSILIVLQTFLSPGQGSLVDRFGVTNTRFAFILATSAASISSSRTRWRKPSAPASTRSRASAR